MNNLPPGVSGTEYQIVGPDTKEEMAYCEHCDMDYETTVDYYTDVKIWMCPVCDREYEEKI